jgi:hypothetical protein
MPREDKHDTARMEAEKRGPTVRVNALTVCAKCSHYLKPAGGQYWFIPARCSAAPLVNLVSGVTRYAACHETNDGNCAKFEAAPEPPVLPALLSWSQRLWRWMR